MLPFWLSIAFLSLVQGALVAAPRPAVAPPGVEGLRNSWWALALPLSILIVIAAVALDAATARLLTYLALVAVPPLAAVALATIVRRARPRWALAVLPLFALAWIARGSLLGQSAALALSALACVSLGWLLACVVAERWLKLGIYAMATIDTWLVASDLLREPNSTLNAAAPAAGMPRLQFVSFGSAAMGFGDLFVAAVLGAMLARDRGLQLTGAVLAAAIALGFDLLFFFVDELPATVPLALALATLEIAGRRHNRQPRERLS